MDILASIQNAVQLAERANDLDLKRALVESLERVQSLREENLALKEENAKLRGQLSLRDELKFDSSVYWRGNDGPYCPTCYDEKGKLIRVQGAGSFRGRPRWRCVSCNNTFEVRRGTPPPG